MDNRSYCGNSINFQKPIKNNQLQLNTNLKGIKQLQLYDLSGKLVSEKVFNQSTLNAKLSLPNSIYLLQISSENVQIQKKLIIAQ